jgi:transcriptional regulator with XRE-family HTH domain
MHRPLKSQRQRVRRIDPWDIEVGRRVRALRLESGMSQTGLADRLGLTFQQVQKYEKGVNRVSAGRLQQIATALNVPVAFFFDGDLNRAAPGRNPESVFAYLQSDQAVRLVKAFARLRNSKLRSSLVALTELLADQG